MLRCSFIAVLALVLIGCAPELPSLSDKELPIDDLLRKINCEMREAVWKQHRNSTKWAFLKDWQGVYTVTLKTVDTTNIAATTNTFPFVLTKSASKLNLGMGGGLKQTATRTATFAYDLNFSDVSQPPFCLSDIEPTAYALVRGRVGFGDWLDRVLNASSWTGAEKLTSVGHIFEFSVDANAGVSPSFVLVPRPISLNPTGSFEDNKDNIVQVAFAKPVPKQGDQTQVDRYQTKDQTERLAKLDSAIEAATKALERLSDEFLDAEKKKNFASGEVDKAKSRVIALEKVPQIEGVNGPNNALVSARVDQTSKQQILLDKITDLDSIRTKISQMKDNLSAKKLERETERVPQGVRTTTLRATGGSGYLLPEQNPYIAQTNLQLLFSNSRAFSGGSP